MTLTRRGIIAAAVVAFAIGLLAGKASATASLTCHHGASSKPCRPDPQPLHGKDCAHPSKGNPSGINQDHCEGSTTSTTSPPATTTTTEAGPTTTSTTRPPTTTSTSAPSPGTTTSTSSPAPAPTLTGTPSTSPEPGTHCATPDGWPYVTSYSACPVPGSAPGKSSAPSASPARELPHTGAAQTVGLTFLGFALLGGGLLMIRISKGGK